MGRPRSMWRPKEPQEAYDAVIIGGGLHGLACAYFLARDHKFKRLAVLERRYFGFGGSGRNTEVIRVNQRAVEIIPFYKAAFDLWPRLSKELNYNLMVWTPGLIGLAHHDFTLNAIRMKAETGRFLGVETELLTPEQIKKRVPALDISDRAALPVIGGYYHPPSGTVRHDAAVWALARGCDRRGVDLCPGVEVVGLKVAGGRVQGVETDQGFISAPLVLNAAGGWSAEVARLAGVNLPVVTLPLQALVTESIKPFLDVVLVSEYYFVYLQQALKGELVMGSHMDPFPSYYTLSSTYEFVAHEALYMLELFPDLARLRLMRQWTGLTDMTPDHAPIMGPSPVEGFYLDVGWGYFGFKSAPMCGKLMAEYMATGRCPEMIASLGLERFETGRLVPEVVMART